MPTYSSFRYGNRLYGDVPATISRSYLLAQVVDYQTITVTVEAASRLGYGYALLRSRNGAAEDPSDGMIVSSGVITSPTFTVADGTDNLTDADAFNDVAVPPGMVYYTLYVFDDAGTWQKDAATSVVMPEDHGTLGSMLGVLPLFYSSEEHNPTDPSTEDSDLGRFLHGPALTYDELSTSIGGILPENRDRNIIRRMHDALAMGVGMPNEYTIGVAANARLFRESGYIYRNKGSLSAIATYAEALTGWQAVVTESDNKILSLDDGSFEASTGNWGATGATVTRVSIDGVGVVGPTFAYEDASAPFQRAAVGVITLTDTTAVVLLPGDSARAKSIPVVAGTSYYVDIPVLASVGTPTAQPKIVWLDNAGAEISTTSLTSAATTGSWVTRSDTVVAPADARFAVLRLDVSGSITDAFQIDMISFSATDGPYRDPRSVTIICQPNRVNLLFDPSMDEAVTTWTAVSGAFETSTEQTIHTGRSGKATGATWEFKSNTIPVVGQYSYAVSAYAYSATGTAQVNVKWYDEFAALISTNTSAFGALTTDWTRLDYSMVSPVDAVEAVVTFSGTNTTYIDAAAFEREDRPQVFFSGSTADYLTQDSLWSDGTPQSYSLLYANRLVKVGRLVQTIEYYLPVGVSARVLLWDSQDPQVLDLVPLGA